MRPDPNRYAFLRNRVAHLLTTAAVDSYFRTELPRQLEILWCTAYEQRVPNAEILGVELDGFTYLFDQQEQRTIAVHGLMIGKNTSPRPASRMRGHPKADGRKWHRGHLIPHSGHGGTDINLFDQQGAINIGPFRRLENLAVANPGSFYFVHLVYNPGSPLQRPNWVEQGLVMKATPPSVDIEVFPN